MKEIYSFKEDDRKYKKFSLTKKEIALLSEYLDYKFPGSVELFCFYDYKNNFLAAQIHEDSKIWELTPEEIKKIFNKIPD